MKQAPSCSTGSRRSSETEASNHHHIRRRSASWGVGFDVQARIPVPEDDSNYIPSTWTVGKLSLIFMILAALTDFATYQVKSLESPELYDALSSEVIRPAFSYHSSSYSANNKPKPGLGSAAISSVTEALSPILPFAGGVDLRREDYWTSSSTPFETLRSLATQIHDAFASNKIDASPETMSVLVKNERTILSMAGVSSSSRQKISHVIAISAPEPFVKIDVIADLALGELAQTFQYVAESSKEGFREGRFLNGLSPRLQQTILGIKNVAAKSRGATVLDTSVASGDGEAAAASSAGNFDILKFCAAMRIFAEWRMVRNCPDGFKGFAMGMSLGHKDIVQNLAKIEQAAHSWLDRRAEMVDLMASMSIPSDAMELRSPTARQLLEDEIEMEVHPNLPYLKEKTAGISLLWVRRQLHYHTQLLDNAMQVPGRFANFKDAVSAAYTEVYDRYHGWAVQKIFNYSFQSAPDEKVIFRHMNPHRLQEAYQAARRKLRGSGASSNNKDAIADGDNEEQQDENPFVSFFKHVGSEWDKIIHNLIKDDDFVVRGGGSSPSSSSQHQQQQDELEDFVTREMLHDAHEQIEAYLQIVYPMLNELAVIFDKNNMEDPTRV